MLIVGLGNPGRKYDGSRHNVGFSVVDRFVEEESLNWLEDKKINALKAEAFIEKSKSLVVKPQTFMNRSGDSLRELLKWQSFEKMVVVYDDLDFEVGQVRLKRGGSSGGHRGLQDIIEKLSVEKFFPDDFLRVRVGIGHPKHSVNPEIDVASWVLQKPSAEERIKLEDAEKFAAKVIRLLITSSEEFVRDFISKR